MSQKLKMIGITRKTGNILIVLNAVVEKEHYMEQQPLISILGTAVLLLACIPIRMFADWLMEKWVCKDCECKDCCEHKNIEDK